MSSFVFLFLKLCFKFPYSSTGYSLVTAARYSCVLIGKDTGGYFVFKKKKTKNKES